MKRVNKTIQFYENVLFKRYRAAAKRRDLPWTLGEDDFHRLILAPCVYCGELPGNRQVWEGENRPFPIAYNGVDRRNNSQGYTLENAHPCCADCNFAKRKRGHAEFITWIYKVARHYRKSLLISATNRDTM
jgi:hypothetical protein